MLIAIERNSIIDSRLLDNFCIECINMLFFEMDYRWKEIVRRLCGWYLISKAIFYLLNEIGIFLDKRTMQCTLISSDQHTCFLMLLSLCNEWISNWHILLLLKSQRKKINNFFRMIRDVKREEKNEQKSYNFKECDINYLKSGTRT